jgi:SAM-dependent methyltransferase
VDTWHCKTQLEITLLHPIWMSVQRTLPTRQLTLFNRTMVPAVVRGEVFRAWNSTLAHNHAIFHSSLMNQEQRSRILSSVANAYAALMSIGGVSTTGVLSLGCYRGKLDARQHPGVKWLRLYDPRCDGVTLPAPFETPLDWMRQLVVDTQLLEHSLDISRDLKRESALHPILSLHTEGTDDVAAHQVKNGSYSLPQLAATHFRRVLQTGSVSSGGVDAAGGSAVIPLQSNEIVGEWSIGFAVGLESLPSDTFGAVTLHWGLCISDRVDALIPAILRVLQPGGVLRIVEPHFAHVQLYHNRAERKYRQPGLKATPKLVEFAMKRDGFVNVSHIALDHTTVSRTDLQSAVVLDTVDDEDIRLWRW